MSYCLNLKCKKPHNPDQARFCSHCGSRLLLGDRYRAQSLISQGRMGRTFLAIDEQNPNQAHCIIKQFSLNNQGTADPKKAIELFREEATRLQALSEHPQIPQFLAYFEPDPQMGMASAIVQQAIVGENLAQQLERQGTFSTAQIQNLLTELLPVLEFIHSHQVIHRDINPHNIIRSQPDHQLVLVDFGAAKFTTKSALAKTGTVIGSAAYTAPEQLMGKAVPSSDLYSLGVTCIHLLTTIHPFDLFNSLEGVWVWQDYLLAPISPKLTKILNKMIEGSVQLRYQSAAEIYQDLNMNTHQMSRHLITTTQSSTPLTPTWKCIETLRGHLSSIHGLAFSPDSQRLASGSADRTVKLWPMDRTLPVTTLSGHSSLIDAVVFSSDGQLLVSGSWDHQIKIWDLQAQQAIHTLSAHSGWIHTLVISLDGRHLISGSADRTLKFWNLQTGELETCWDGYSSPILSLAISPNGTRLASGFGDGTIRIWDLIHREIQLTLNEDQSAIHALTFSPSSQLLIAGTASGQIKVWNLTQTRLLQTVNAHAAAINTVAMNGKGSLLVSGSADQTLKLWHPGRGELLQTLSDHTAGIRAVVISPDDSLLASGSQDQTIKLWRFQ